MGMNSFYEVMVIALATAAISLTISKGRIFIPLREWIASRNTWLGELVSCFYCTSHWVAIALVVIYQPVLLRKWLFLDLLVSVFVVVSVSTLVCGAIIRLTSMGEDNSAHEEIESLRGALESARGVIQSQQEKIRQFQEQ
jgi:hypothetical protein